jgi:formyl-CoA transferase
MGLSPAVLHAINPALVILRVSGWGQDGPFAHKPGFGTLVEGYSGFAAVNGFADREPVLPPFFMGDTYAGLHGAAAAMIALRHAEATGEGQVVDLSLFEPLFAVLEPQMANWRITGRRSRAAAAVPPTPPRATPTGPGTACGSASAPAPRA